MRKVRHGRLGSYVTEAHAWLSRVDLQRVTSTRTTIPIRVSTATRQMKICFKILIHVNTLISNHTRRSCRELGTRFRLYGFRFLFQTCKRKITKTSVDKQNISRTTIENVSYDTNVFFLYSKTRQYIYRMIRRSPTTKLVFEIKSVY